MNISKMTLEQLENVKITSGESGRNFAQELQEERVHILKPMAGA